PPARTPHAPPPPGPNPRPAPAVQPQPHPPSGRGKQVGPASGGGRKGDQPPGAARLAAGLCKPPEGLAGEEMHESETEAVATHETTGDRRSYKINMSREMRPYSCCRFLIRAACSQSRWHMDGICGIGLRTTPPGAGRAGDLSSRPCPHVSQARSQ